MFSKMGDGMLIGVLKTLLGLCLTIGLCLGLAWLEIGLIPIRGPLLTLIIAISVQFVLIPGVLLSLYKGRACS